MISHDFPQFPASLQLKQPSKRREDGEIKEAVPKAEGVAEGFMGLDCGPQSIELNAKAVAESKTIIWNGPMGGEAMERRVELLVFV